MPALIEDLTTTIKAQLYERVSSPLLSSFSLSWCGWNYKFLLIVFSGMSSHEKIIYIDMNLFPNFMAMLTHGIILPLVTSLLLIFVYPIPAEFIYKHVKIQQRRLKEIQQSIDDESPLSKEQARKIRKESLEIQLKYDNEIDAKTSENARLKAMISELQQKIDESTEVLRSYETPKDAFEESPSGGQFDIGRDELPDLLARYEAAKNDETFTPGSKNTSDDLESDHRKNELDNFVRSHLLNYIGKLNSFSDVRFDVIATKGMLQVLLGQPDGTYFPYISGEYNTDSVIRVLESIKNALASGAPPKSKKEMLYSENKTASENIMVVRDYIVKCLADRKSLPDIRDDLLAKGVPESVLKNAFPDFKREDGNH